MDKWTYCPVNLSATRHKLQCVSASPPFPRLGAGVLLLRLESVSCFCVDTGGAVETWCYHLLLGELLKKTAPLKVFLKVLPQNIDISYIIPLLMWKGRVPTMAHVVSAGELPGNTPPVTYMYTLYIHIGDHFQENLNKTHTRSQLFSSSTHQCESEDPT